MRSALWPARNVLGRFLFPCSREQSRLRFLFLQFQPEPLQCRGGHGWCPADTLHKHCIVQSPNVYNVVVPGRFEIIWANVTMSATMEGKLRKCSHMYEELNMHYTEKNSQKTTQVADGNNSKAVRVAYSGDAFQALKAITPDTLWPDAWKISIKIKDLGVNCFNNYLNYQAYGSTGARLIANTTEKTQVDAAWSAIESTFKKYVDKLSGKEKEEAQKKLDSAKSMYEKGTSQMKSAVTKGEIF